MDKIQLKALAKINLGLDVLRKREDGYHEVRMIMQTINLYDELELKKLRQPGIQIQTNLSYLPTDEHNLAYKAAKLFMEEYKLPGGICIQLQKRIPVAAGMAGGSSDAAAVLWGINQMYHLGLSRKELMKWGVQLGADVPYCIQRGTALAEGIGEKLTALPPMPKCYILIAKPGVSVSTKYVYENLHANELGAAQHPDVDAMLEALRKNDLALLASRMGNVLELVTIPVHPVIDKIKTSMQKAGAIGAMMSGSGPTVFGVFDKPAKARVAYRAIRASQLAKQVYLTVPYNVHR